MRKLCYFLCALIIFGFCPAIAKTTKKEIPLIQQVCARQPKINIKFPMPQVNYISNLSPKQFCAKLGQPECHTESGSIFCTKGITVPPSISSIQLTLKAHPIMYKKKTYTCPTAIDIIVKYQNPTMNVYLSNEYAKSSCAYRVIKEHEDYHVEVFKQSIPFYKPQIYKYLIQETGRLPAYTPATSEDVQNIATQYVNILSQKLQPVQEYINRTINAKNAAIDTPEAYWNQQRQCKQW